MCYPVASADYAAAPIEHPQAFEKARTEDFYDDSLMRLVTLPVDTPSVIYAVHPALMCLKKISVLASAGIDSDRMLVIIMQGMGRV